MNIHPVQNQKNLTAFIELPYRLYKNDPIWIPPLRDEQRGQFDPKRNPLLDHCAWQLFLLEDAGQVIGRIAAFIDTLAVDFWKEAIGLFGYYECVPDPSTGSPVPACPAVSHRRAAVACGTNGGWRRLVDRLAGLLVPPAFGIICPGCSLACCLPWRSGQGTKSKRWCAPHPGPDDASGASPPPRPGHRPDLRFACRGLSNRCSASWLRFQRRLQP